MLTTTRHGLCVAAMCLGLAAATHAQTSLAPAAATPLHVTGTTARFETAAPARATEAPPEPAAEPVVPREWVGQNNPWPSWTRATGDWNLTRQRLSEKGIDIALSAASDVSRVDPSDAPTGTFGRGLFDGVALVNLERLAGVRGAMVGVRAQGKAGPNAAPFAGDHQGFSNIDASRVSRVYEVWWEQWILRERLQVKAGRMDANNDFAGTDVGGDFLNSSMGFSPTILFFPTFPAPRLAANVMYAPHRAIEVRAGIYDGMDDETDRSPDPASDLLLLAQVAASWKVGDRPGRASVGVWHHTGILTRLDGDAQADGVTGPFATVEQTLVVRRTGAMRRLAVFAQYGSADGRVHEIDRHVGAGLVATAPHASRPNDAVGAGATLVRLSAGGPGAEGAGWEAVGEVFYRVQVTGWLALQPDVQFMRHRHAAGRHSGVFATCRLLLEF